MQHDFRPGQGAGAGLMGYRIYRNGALVTLVMAPNTAYTDIALTASANRLTSSSPSMRTSHDWPVTPA